LVAGLVLLGACSRAEPTTVPPPAARTEVTIEARTAYWPTYPCTQCHVHERGASNPRERELTEFHTGTNELVHGKFVGWCYRCHAPGDVAQFVLPDARRVPFDQSYELCGSCHGEKLADWRAGVHGLTTGQWDGAQLRRSCTHCHNPHQPKFPTMVALPLRPAMPPAANAQARLP